MAESKIRAEFDGITMSSGDFNAITYPTMRRIDNGQSAISNFPNVSKWGTFICIIPVLEISNPYGFQIYIPNDASKIAVRGYVKNTGFTAWKYITPTAS